MIELAVIGGVAVAGFFIAYSFGSDHAKDMAAKDTELAWYSKRNKVLARELDKKNAKIKRLEERVVGDADVDGVSDILNGVFSDSAD